MRAIFLVLPVVLLANSTVLGDEATALRDRVLKAYGTGTDDLKRLHNFSIEARGVSVVNGQPVSATFDLVASWPGKLKAGWTFGEGTNKRSVVMCGTNDRGWKRLDGSVPIDLTVEEMNDFRADVYAVWASTLIPLGDAATKLEHAGKSKVGDDPVVGLKLTKRPWPEVTLYFHEKTGLLRKMSYRSREAGVNMTKEMTYDGHKSVGGIMLPTQQSTVVQGRQVYTWTDMKFTLLDKEDTKAFEK